LTFIKKHDTIYLQIKLRKGDQNEKALFIAKDRFGLGYDIHHVGDLAGAVCHPSCKNRRQIVFWIFGIPVAFDLLFI
jgi:hypothetical protein